jgi:predicted nucleic acid-binding protein
MAGLVLDASVTLAAVLQEANAALAANLIDCVAAERAVVPSHWHLEVGNALLMSERRGNISPSQRAAYVEDLLSLPIECDPETSTRAWRECLMIASQYRLTLYDAAYLELSMRRSLPLATFDAALRRAAAAAGVALL